MKTSQRVPHRVQSNVSLVLMVALPLLLGAIGSAIIMTAGGDGPGAVDSPPFSGATSQLVAQGSPSNGGAAGGASGNSGAITVLAAGDIASCSSGGDEATAALLDRLDGIVLTLGDNAYNSGTRKEFVRCYEPSWGRHKNRTRPAVGNHEYRTDNASGYFDYFGTAAGDPDKGYYSFDLGSWHVIALNSNCSKIGGCGPGSPQLEWLIQDLAKHPATCTLAYWHHARFSSSSEHGSDDRTQPLWEALYKAGTDVVLVAHDHTYERFAPLNDQGELDPQDGIRQFVVGTGGRSHYGFDKPLPGSEVRKSGTFGVLKLTLRDGGYDWEFVPVNGEHFTDSGSGQCH